MPPATWPTTRTPTLANAAGSSTGGTQNTAARLLYLKEKILRAYFAVNTGAKDFPALQKLIKQKKDLSGKEAQLRDPSVPVKSLA